jgi:hypothetical protein
MEPRRALSPPDLDPPASSVAALQLLHGVLHCNLTYTKTARSCVPLLRRTSCANARRTRPASALRLQVTGHPQHNRRIDQREPPAGWDLAPKQRCCPGPPTPEPAGGAESSVPPRSVHAGRSWVDDRPLTPVVLHARSATASDRSSTCTRHRAVRHRGTADCRLGEPADRPDRATTGQSRERVDYRLRPKPCRLHHLTRTTTRRGPRPDFGPRLQHPT